MLNMMSTLASGISYIDLDFQETPRTIASAVLAGADEIAIVDPGPSSTLPALRRGLAVAGLSVQDVSESGVNLGWKEVRLPAPVFAGDTIRAETEVLEKRESKSRPDKGIVTVRTRGLNQRDEVVIEFERSIMMPL